MILHGFDGQFDIFIGATACKNQCPKQFFSWYVKVDYLWGPDTFSWKTAIKTQVGFSKRFFLRTVWAVWCLKKVKVADSRLPSVGFQSWSRFLAVNLHVTWIINPKVGCHYFLPGLQLPPQPLRGLLPVLLLGEQRYSGCERLRFEPGPFCARVQHTNHSATLDAYKTYKSTFYVAHLSLMYISKSLVVKAHTYSGAFSVDLMHLFILVLDRVLNLYQLTVSSCAGSYYHSHMLCFASPCLYDHFSCCFCKKSHLTIYLYVHTHTRLTALFPGLPRWAGTRQVKPIWILLKQETVSGSGISWAICKSAPCSRQITTPATHHSVFYRPDALPATQPTASKHWRDNTYIFTQLLLCQVPLISPWP